MMTFQMNILLCMVLLYNLQTGLQLKPIAKKHSLRLAVALPIGGKVNPTGNMCLNSLELLLDKVNSQSRILPDYSVSVDVIDDECSGSAALKRIVPFFESWPNGTAGPGITRLRAGIRHNESYTPPMLAGPICSGVCKAIGYLPQHYNLIQVTSGCVHPAVDNRVHYRNLFRIFPSTKNMSATRLKLTELLGFRRVAILTDITQYTYPDAVHLMALLSQHDIEVVTEEFVPSDPDRAVARLKNAGVRVIFSICYINNCPAIACSAFKQNFYGPNVVWIFSSSLMSRKLIRPKWCSPWMTDEIAESSLLLRPDVTAMSSPGEVSEIGISASQVTEYLKLQSKLYTFSPAFGWRLLCFQTLHNAVFIADSVEKSLQRAGQSLVNFSGQSTLELTERFKQAALDLNVRGIWGPSQTSPRIVVEQVQKGRLRGILVDSPSGLSRIGDDDFVWRTSDGKVPKSQIEVVHEPLNVSVLAANIIRCLASVVLFMVVSAIYSLVRFRNHFVFQNNLGLLNFTALLGIIFPVVALLLYPVDKNNDLLSFNNFCLIGTTLVACGSVFTFGSLVVKTSIPYFVQPPYPQSLDKGKKLKIYSSFGIWVVVNVVFQISIRLNPQNLPKAATKIEVETSQLPAEFLTCRVWRRCAFENWIFGFVLMGCHLFFALAGIALALLSWQNNSTHNYMKDIAAARTCLCVLFPTEVALVTAITAMDNFAIQYAVLAIHALAQSFAVLFILVYPKLREAESQSTNRALESTVPHGPQGSTSTPSPRFRSRALSEGNRRRIVRSKPRAQLSLEPCGPIPEIVLSRHW